MSARSERILRRVHVQSAADRAGLESIVDGQLHDFSDDDAVAFLSFTEEINPGLSEQYACDNMKRLMDKYQNREGPVMAFRLTTAEQRTRDEWVTKLQTAKSKVEEAIAKANNTISAAVAEVNVAVAEYNGVLEDTENFLSDIGSRLREEYDNKSETWQDSERGQSASEFVDMWESLALEHLEDVEVEEIAVPDMEHPDDLESAAVEVE